MVTPDALVHCLPERLHPVSRMFLEHWLRGDFSTAEFLRWFHMPNSDYIAVADCLVKAAAQSL
ncbi:MAG: hypothetical protein RIC87_02045 [Kiloniellales bacterium]